MTDHHGRTDEDTGRDSIVIMLGPWRDLKNYLNERSQEERRFSNVYLTYPPLFFCFFFPPRSTVSPFD